MSDLRDLLHGLAGDDEWARHTALERLKREGLPDRDLQALRRALADDDDAAARSAARMALAALATPGSPGQERAAAVLQEALRSPQTDLRILAAVALGETGDRENAGPLIAALDDAEPNVAASAAEALGALGHAGAIGPLARIAADGGFWVRAAAVAALGRIKDPRAIPALARAGSEPKLTGPVIESLRTIGHRDALPVLDELHRGAGTAALLAAGAILSTHPDAPAPDWVSAAARDAEPALREIVASEENTAAARVLGLANTPSALDALLEAAGPPRRSEAALAGILAVPPDHRADAILTRLPDADATACVALLSVLPPLHTEEWIRRLLPLLDDDDPTIRAAAAESLARAPSEHALPLLASRLDRPSPEPEVLRALGNLGGIACSRLIPLLEDASARVRKAAADALTRCATPDVAERIEAALDQEEDTGVRSALLRALGRAGGADAVPRLARALDEESLEARMAAVYGLGATGSRAALPHLERHLDTPAPEPLTVLQALGDLAHPDVAPVLEDAFEAADLDTRRVAARAAMRIPEAISARGLGRLRRDQDSMVRLCAVRILAARGSEGRQWLEEVAAGDPASAVRTEAVRVLRGEG